MAKKFEKNEHSLRLFKKKLKNYWFFALFFSKEMYANIAYATLQRLRCWQTLLASKNISCLIRKVC